MASANLTQLEKDLFRHYYGLGFPKRKSTSEIVEPTNEKRIKRSPKEPTSSKPKCPLCGQIIIVLPGEDPNEKVDEHIDFACSHLSLKNQPKQSPPPTVTPKSNGTKVNGDGKKGKEQQCSVCRRKYKDIRSATHPENMSKFFAITKGYEGSLKREDVLCKPCYSSFFTKKKKDKIPKKKEEEELDISPESSPSKRVLKCRWIGERVDRRGGKDTYASVELEDIVYKVGDSVRFKAPVNQRSFLGKITSFYQSSSVMYVECMWYFFPDDIPNIADEMKHPHQVFESELKDSNSIGALESLAQVISEHEYTEMESKGDNMENIFFCKWFYNHKSKSFKPLNKGSVKEQAS